MESESRIPETLRLLIELSILTPAFAIPGGASGA